MPLWHHLILPLIILCALPAPTNAFQVQKIKDETLPEELMVPNLKDCDVEMGGWVLVVRCMDTRLMVSDLQSWTDPYLDAPKFYWKKNIESGNYRSQIQPVVQFSGRINQVIFVEIKSKRLIFSLQVDNILNRANNDRESINLASAQYSSLDNTDFIINELSSSTNWHQILFDDEVMSIMQHGSNIFCLRKVP